MLLDPLTFLGLRPTDDPRRWRCTVTKDICTQGDFIYGGCGLALGLVPLEHLTGRPPIWVATQFLSYAGDGAELEILAEEGNRGHQVSQARSVVRTGGREVLRVQASLGSRTFPDRGRWVQPPALPDPDECPEADRWFASEGTIAMRMDIRDPHPLIDADPRTTGRVAFWGRVPELDGSSSSLALSLLADSMMMGVHRAIGRPIAGNSLDNTLRLVEPGIPPEEDDDGWLVLDHRVEAVGDGFASATSYLWTRSGRLRCIASQTARLREIPAELLPGR